jgi:hypothetical protein
VVVEQLVDLQTIKEDARFRESSFSTALDLENLKNSTTPASDPSTKINLPPKEKKNELKEDYKESTTSDLKKNALLKPLKDYQLEQALNVIRVMALLEQGDGVPKLKENLSKMEPMNASGK